MSTLSPLLPATTSIAASPPQPAGVILINEKVRLPANITTLDAFRQWARSDDCPEKGRFAFLNGVFYVDLTMEQLYTHNQVKGEFTIVLGGLVKTTKQGLYMADGMLVSNARANLSTVPDGVFVTDDALDTGRVREVPNVRNVGATELDGTPDMVLEVVSDSSEEKDFVVLPSLYYQAGVAEFWRVDARGDLRFEIFRWTASGYALTQLSDGWWRSDVFARDFLLVAGLNRRGRPQFALQER